MMNYNKHNDEWCPNYNDKVLPNEAGKCSLCNATLYIESEQLETWTLTVQMTVFAGDMPKDNVISNAEEALPNLLDGTDFTGVVVIDAKRDEI